MAGIGVVIRDYRGLVIASCMKKLPQAYNGVDVEAMTVAMALSLATDIGISRVVLEGNSGVVIKALMDDVFAFASFGLLVKDTKVLPRNFDQ